MTQVNVTRYVDCPFSAALELAEKAAVRRSGLYLTPAPPLGERVRFAVSSTDDSTDEVRKHDALLIAWRPQTAGMFPEFRGVLTVRPKNRGATIRISGRYEPPYGAAGKLFDFVAGRVIARYTLHNFLGELAADIQAEYARERDQNKPITAGV